MMYDHDFDHGFNDLWDDTEWERMVTVVRRPFGWNAWTVDLHPGSHVVQGVVKWAPTARWARARAMRSRERGEAR